MDMTKSSNINDPSVMALTVQMRLGSWKAIECMRVRKRRPVVFGHFARRRTKQFRYANMKIK